jgi:hypothetical protein
VRSGFLVLLEATKEADVKEDIKEEEEEGGGGACRVSDDCTARGWCERNSRVAGCKCAEGRCVPIHWPAEINWFQDTRQFEIFIVTATAIILGIVIGIQLVCIERWRRKIPTH